MHLFPKDAEALWNRVSSPWRAFLLEHLGLLLQEEPSLGSKLNRSFSGTFHIPTRAFLAPEIES